MPIWRIFFFKVGEKKKPFEHLKVQFFIWPPGSRQMPWKKGSSIKWKSQKPQKENKWSVLITINEMKNAFFILKIKNTRRHMLKQNISTISIWLYLKVFSSLYHLEEAMSPLFEGKQVLLNGKMCQFTVYSLELLDTRKESKGCELPWQSMDTGFLTISL